MFHGASIVGGMHHWQHRPLRLVVALSYGHSSVGIQVPVVVQAVTTVQIDQQCRLVESEIILSGLQVTKSPIDCHVGV